MPDVRDGADGSPLEGKAQVRMISWDGDMNGSCPLTLFQSY